MRLESEGDSEVVECPLWVESGHCFAVKLGPRPRCINRATAMGALAGLLPLSNMDQTILPTSIRLELTEPPQFILILECRIIIAELAIGICPQAECPAVAGLALQRCSELVDGSLHVPSIKMK